MIVLNNIEKEKCIGFSYTFLNPVLTIHVDSKLSDSLVYYHQNDDIIINVICSENGSCEFAEIFNDDYNNFTSERIIECNGNFKHIVFNFSSISKFNYLNSTSVFNNGKYELIYLDFNTGNSNINNYVNLKSAGTSGTIYLASTVNKDYHKEILNRVDNNAKSTNAFMHNYGVSFDDGRLHIKGIGSISKGCSKSKTDQQSEIYLMDENSFASNEPILYIDEDDVEASHASAVGQIDENTIFYLCSRGLNKDVARKIVVLGQFKSFINLIENDDLKDMANKYLNEVIHND